MQHVQACWMWGPPAWVSVGHAPVLEKKNENSAPVLTVIAATPSTTAAAGAEIHRVGSRVRLCEAELTCSASRVVRK